MGRRRKITAETDVAEIVRQLRRLDIYNTGEGLAARAAQALERQAAEIAEQAGEIHRMRQAIELWRTRFGDEG